MSFIVVPCLDPLYQAGTFIPQLLWVLAEKYSSAPSLETLGNCPLVMWAASARSYLPSPPLQPLTNTGVQKADASMGERNWCKFCSRIIPLWIRPRLDFSETTSMLSPCLSLSCFIPSCHFSWRAHPQQVTWSWILVSGSALGSLIEDIWFHEWPWDADCKNRLWSWLLTMQQ